MLGLIMEAGVY